MSHCISMVTPFNILHSPPMSPWLFWCAALAVVNDGFAGLGNDKQGPYDILIKFIEDCSEGDIDTVGVDVKFYPKMQRVNRSTLVVNGYIISKVDLDNTVMWTLQLDQKTPQGFKDNFFFTDFKKKDLCTTLKEYGDENDYKRLFGAIKNVDPPYTGCPIKAGKYEFEINVLVEPFKKVPMFFFNTYRTTIRFYKNFDTPSSGCIRIIADLIPKKRKG